MAVGTTLKYLGFQIEIPDQHLEENIIKICKDSDINISQTSSGKKPNQHNETSYCEIC